MSDKTEYSRWKGMMYRCYNPNHVAYKDYGGRGIRVCERWHTYGNFAEDIGIVADGLTIDRIDNDGNYEPSNVRFVDRKTQQNNTRKTIRLTLDGVTKPLSEWVEVTGIERTTIWNRLDAGWTEEEALTTPVQHNEHFENLWKTARDNDINRTTLSSRLDRGYTPEDALSKPVQTREVVSYKGREQSLRKWCDELGVPYHAAYRRLQLGWKVEDAFETPVESKPTSGKVRSLTLDNVTKTIPEWAQEFGVNYKIIHSRLARGWTTEQALRSPVVSKPNAGKVKTLTLDGVSKTVQEWAKELGIKPKTIHYRLSAGFPIEKALSPELMRK